MVISVFISLCAGNRCSKRTTARAVHAGCTEVRTELQLYAVTPRN